MAAFFITHLISRALARLEGRAQSLHVVNTGALPNGRALSAPMHAPILLTNSRDRTLDVRLCEQEALVYLRILWR